MKHQIVLASRNRKKTGEIADLLRPHGFDVVPLTEFPDIPDVVEDGSTFAENAAKKATEVARTIGQWVIGEDSGLEVDALGGAPGIYSPVTAENRRPTTKTIRSCCRKWSECRRNGEGLVTCAASLCPIRREQCGWRWKVDVEAASRKISVETADSVMIHFF